MERQSIIVTNNKLAKALKRRSIKNFKRELRESSHILKRLSTTKFGVLNSDAWKVKTHYQYRELIENGENLEKQYIFVGDINNLRLVNDEEGIEAADNHIQIMIDNMQSILQEEKVNYTIGKRDHGDEIYINITNIDTQKAETILAKLNAIQSGRLSISFGHSNDFSKGVEGAIHQADERMFQEKNRRKNELQREVFGDNVSMITQSFYDYYKTILAQMRIDVKSLSDKQKRTLKGNIEKREQFLLGIESPELLKDSIMKDIKMAQQQEQRDVTFQKIEEYEGQIRENHYYTVTQEQTENVVLSQILKYHTIAGIREGYFKMKNMSSTTSWNLLGKLNERRKMNQMKKKSIVTIEMHRVKYVNDFRGHGECDRQIKELMDQIDNLREVYGLKEEESLVGDGISNYSFSVESSKQKEVEQFKKEVMNLRRELLVSVEDSAVEMKEGSSIYELFANARDKNDEKIRQGSNERKVNDIAAVKVYLNSSILELYQSRLLDSYAQKTGRSKENIVSKILDEVLELSTPEGKEKTSEERGKESVMLRAAEIGDNGQSK